MTTSSGPRPAPASGEPDRSRATSRSSGGRRIRGLEPEQRRQERRRQLLDSALQHFATQGYARTSIEQICQGAYVGFKGFYDEFATKEALFLALYGELVEQVSASVAAVVVGPEFSSRVRELLEAFVRAVLDDARVARVLFIEAAGLSPTVEATRRATYRSFADFLFASWVGSRQAGGARLPEGMVTHRISLGLVGAIVGLMVDWLADSTCNDIDALIDDLEVFCQVLLAGIDASLPPVGTPSSWP